MIRELKAEGMTMVIATHEMGFAREVADEVCFLHEGAILERGAPERIFSAPERPETQRFLRRLLDAGQFARPTQIATLLEAALMGASAKAHGVPRATAHRSGACGRRHLRAAPSSRRRAKTRHHSGPAAVRADTLAGVARRIYRQEAAAPSATQRSSASLATARLIAALRPRRPRRPARRRAAPALRPRQARRAPAASCAGAGR